MRIFLFGVEITLPHQGALGPNTTLDARLAPNQASIALDFKRNHPASGSEFRGNFPCQIEGDLVRLLPLTTPLVGATASVQLFAGTPALSFQQPRLVVRPDQGRLGIFFRDQTRLLRSALRKIHLENSLETFAWGSDGDWSDLVFSFDLGADSILFLPEGNGTHSEILVSDVLLDSIEAAPGVERIQQLALTSVRAKVGQVEVIARPHGEMLLVHPDILVTRGAQRDGNDLLFQHALVNGELSIQFGGDDGTQQTFQWQGRDSQPAGMLAFRLSDEHGHPLLIESESFPLTHRRGISIELTSEDDPALWEMTIQGTVVDPGHAGVHIRSIDPASVDLQSSHPEQKWLKDGRVAPGKAPREIHGLAKGTFLERNDPGNVESVQGSLRTEHVEVEGLGRLFTKTELAVDVSQWKLNAQLEERDVYGQVAPKPADPAVGLRQADPKAGELRMPLIDTSYALANLADETGKVQSGHILRDTVAWLHELDQQFVHPQNSVFHVPNVTEQTHVSGFEIAPLSAQPFQSILDLPPGQADSAAGTARTGAVLHSKRVDFVHGGERKPKTHEDLNTALQGSGGFTIGLQAFQTYWYSRTLPADQAAARAMLQKYLGEARPQRGALDAEVAVVFQAALEILYGNRILETFTLQELARLRTFVPQGSSFATFRTLWETATDPLVVAFLDALWSPAGPALYRRAVDALYPERIQPDNHPAAVLKESLLLLQDIIRGPGPADDPLAGFLTPTVQGVDPIFSAVADLWRTATALDELRRKYGFGFTGDVYRRLLQPAAGADLKVLFAALQQAQPALVGGLNVAAGLDFLRRIPSEPPEYVFFTRRFPVERTKQPEDLWDRLWNHHFRLCGVGNGKAWNFLLDSDSSVIVKLTGQRRLEEILKEIEESYRSPDRPNPLNLPVSRDEFVAGLDPDLRQSAWRGVLIVRPTADISQDKILADLAGLSQLPIQYVALGGAKPDVNLEDLDVYARIFQEKTPQKVDDQALGDLGLTLIKFDATIKNTRLRSGVVDFRLDVRNLWGRESKFDTILVCGTLPPEREGDTGGRSFEFAAWLPQPVELPVNLAFVKSFVLRSMRVSSNKGQTAIDIDGDVLLQKWDGLNLPGLGSGFSIDLGDLVDRIGLQNFRILIPKLESGKGLRMGLPRLLNFEFPALSFNLPRPRPLNLWGGIELKPFGMGFLRRIGDALGELKALVGRYQWLHGFQPGNLDFTFPYLRCEIDFGKLPRFGGTGLSRLKLELLIGLVIKGHGELPTIALGLGGLDAKDIHIDLFGVAQLDIEELALGLFETLLDHRKAAAIHVKNPRLSILGWSPLPDSAQLQLLFAQAADLGDPDGRAVLGWYADSIKNDSFFQLYWLLLAHNLELDSKILDHLLSGGFGADTPKLLDGLVDTEQKKIQAKILNNDSWLLGASFRLGEIVEQGTFVLHDQHYYGISLRGNIVQLLFGVPQLELAYIPGPTRSQDRFRTSLRLPALDMLGPLRSGEIGLEWGFNWDFLIDFGFPWKQGSAYLWERAFTMPIGVYEAKFGLYFERRSQPAPAGTQSLVLGAGAGFYLGYGTGFGNPGTGVWARAGIGVFGILEGRIRFAPAPANSSNPLKGGIQEIDVRGVLGIWAYGDGGIEVWVISARFRVSVQAAIAGELHYLPGGNSTFAYEATLSAGYSASCRVGSGFFSFTFEVSGQFDFHVSGQLLLS